eukprot:6133437-Amphidinium_carterae.3
MADYVAQGWHPATNFGTLGSAETAILAQIEHPFIVNLLATFQATRYGLRVIMSPIGLCLVSPCSKKDFTTTIQRCEVLHNLVLAMG